MLRERLTNVMKPEGPRVFVLNTCRQFIRTVLILTRDEIDMDDADTTTALFEDGTHRFPVP